MYYPPGRFKYSSVVGKSIIQRFREAPLQSSFYLVGSVVLLGVIAGFFYNIYQDTPQAYRKKVAKRSRKAAAKPARRRKKRSSKKRSKRR